MSEKSYSNDTIPVSLRKIVDNTAQIAGGGPGGPTPWGSITGDITNQTDLVNYVATHGGGGATGMFATLSTVNSEMATPLVQHTTPAVGSSTTLATFTGVGVVDMIWITLGTSSNGTMGYDGRLQVFVDGAALPDIDTDLGTLFLTALDGHTGMPRCAATQHLSYSTQGDSGSGMSGGLKFPVPYSNGIVIKLYAPPGSISPGTDGTLFTQISNKPGIVSNLRLRSNAISWLNKKSYGPTDIITFFDLVNAAGWLVWQSIAVQGAGTTGNYYDFLERIWFWGIDGESTTPDGNGVVTTKFSSSGGEDLFLYGWYFASTQGVFGTPWTLVSATGNANRTTIAGFDHWASNGGLKFNTELKPGWSLKPGNVINYGHSMSWCFLYYIDTSVPFAPSAPGLSASAGNGQVTLTITPPTSYGSSQITGYVGTYSPGGGSFNVSAGSTSYLVTGLTNNTFYTFTLKAVNSVGQSTPATATATPTSIPFPTISSATIMARYTASSISSVSNGSPVNTWVRERGANAVDLIAGAGPGGPLFIASGINGLPTTRWTGNGNNQLFSSASFNTAQPTAVVVVFKASSAVRNQIWYATPTGSHGSQGGGIDGSVKWATWAGIADVEHSTTPDTNAHTLVFVQNGSSSYVRLDGNQSSSGNAGTGGIDDLDVGVIFEGILGDMSEFILISGTLSGGDMTAIENYCRTVYNTP